MGVAKKCGKQELGLTIDVIPVDMPEIRDLARLGGVLNCISWQVY